jgi:hypothetical protein
VTLRGLKVAALLVVVLELLLLGRSLTSRFNAGGEFNSALHTQFARNHLAYGLSETRLYCTRGVTLEPPTPPQRYLNHPPLLALWVAAPLALLGDHEWAARLVPIAATVGSTALLMTLLSRLGGPLLGAFGGLFFALLPLTVQFGQMVDHVAPVQFLSLLMVHGYLHWTGGYGEDTQRRKGVLWFTVGAVLGIGTGWAAVLMAGLLWGWHALRVRRGEGDARLLLWLAALPAAALAAVVLHILAATGGDLSMLAALLATRSIGGDGGQPSLPAWLARQWLYAVRVFTLPGALAAVLGVPALLVQARRGMRRLHLRQPDLLLGFLAVTGLQGLLYVVILKESAWFHDYWQFFLGPFVAASLASLAVTVRAALKPMAPRLTSLALALLVAAPLPGLVSSLEFYDRLEHFGPRYLEALERLAELVPRRAPVWTSRRPRSGQEVLGDHVNRWGNPIEVYYADRPLHYSRDPGEVEANAPDCAAFLLGARNRGWSREIAQALRSYEVVPVGDHHLIFLLEPGLEGGPDRTKAPRAGVSR